jgi:hypothetical protein
LALLSDAEYDEGMKKILDDLAEREGRGLPLSLVVDLRFYGTVGWKPGEERRGTTSAVCQVCQP